MTSCAQRLNRVFRYASFHSTGASVLTRHGGFFSLTPVVVAGGTDAWSSMSGVPFGRQAWPIWTGLGF